jgi:hypothetical protein
VRHGLPARSITEFSRVEWSSLLAEPARTWFHFQALERMALPAFSPVYFAIRCEGRLRGAIAGFLVDGRSWPHPASIQDDLARAVRRMTRGAPGRAVVLGSPINEPCSFAVAADAGFSERRELLEQLLLSAERYAEQQGCGALAVKNTEAKSVDLWSWACARVGLKRVRGRPLRWHRARQDTTYSWYRAGSSWLDRCHAVVDSAFGVDLRSGEL